MADAQNEICTIGYEGVTAEALVKALAEASIEVLIDVRAVPLSRKPGLSKNKLASKLAESNIRHVGLKGLGTPSEGREAARKGRIAEMRRIFAHHLTSEIATIELDQVVKIASGSKTCLLCFEHEAEACHRLLVAEMISTRTGQTITNLDPVRYL